MSPEIATLAFSVGILGLFALNWDPKARTSPALWLPVIWLSISASRPVSDWLNVNPVGATIDLLQGNPFERNIYICLIALGLLVLSTRLGRVSKILRINLPILLFVGYAALSILWSDYPTVAFKRWIKLLGDFVVILIVLTDPDRSNAFKRVLTRVAFLLIPLSVLLNRYYPLLSRYYSPWEGTQCFRGVSADKNMLGMCLLVFGLGSTWRLFEEWCGPRRTKILLAHGVVLVLTLRLFRMADSMTSLACFLLGSGLLAATSLTRIGRRPGFVRLAAVPAVLSACLLFLSFGDSLLTLIGRDPTLTGRTEIWEKVIEMNPNPVLGTGFESFWLGERLATLRDIWWWHPNQAHNGYIEIYLNLGWVGVFLIAIVIVAAYKNVTALLIRDPEAGRLRLAFFVVALVYNCTEAAIKMLHPVWIAFLFAAIAFPEPSTVKGKSRMGQARIPFRHAPNPEPRGLVAA